MSSCVLLFLISIADFHRFESHSGVVAWLAPATPNVEAPSKNDRGGRDKPGHDRGERSSPSIIQTRSNCLRRGGPRPRPAAPPPPIPLPTPPRTRPPSPPLRR